MPMIPKKRVPWREREPEVRRRSFDEVALGYTPEQARAEAMRCLYCQEPVCEQGCPVGVPIRDFVRLIAEGDLPAAARRMREVNRLPAICGRVCPQESQCEAVCSINSGRQEPVAIGRLERFIADWERQNMPSEVTAPAHRQPQKVAIVGAGPAGLTCAYDLALLGYQVTILEALHKVGGVLAYGIPDFRLPKGLIQDLTQELQELGVEVRTSVVVGKTVTIDQIFEDLGYDAIFIGTGAGTPVFLRIPGENLKGIYSANEYLTRINLMRAHLFPQYDTPIRVGKRVAVIGAGDTAMDSVRTSLRVGADEAFIIYRRSEAEMSARVEEYHHALEEGVVFHWLTLPIRFLGNEQGWVRGMECMRMELGEPDASGRRRPVPVPGSEFIMEVDTAVIAIGTNPNTLAISTALGIATNGHGCIVADPETGATSREGVFAGGDIVTGAATVILAMGAGRTAASSIQRYLREKARCRQAAAGA